MNVLLLEDDLDLSAVASEQIESRGHKVFPALSIAQAKEIMADKTVQIDILIADQLVPDGNGAQFAIQVKESPDSIQTVVVSGHLSDTDIQVLNANGVSHYDQALALR